MSLVLKSRDSSLGPPLGLDVSSQPVYVSGGAPAQEKQTELVGVPCLPGYIKRDGDEGAEKGFHTPVAEEGSSETSSIGDPSDGEEGEEVESKLSGSLVSLGSLEDSLPFKRGLSNYFSGKSKSFANLSDVSSVKEVEKEENPLNKRRRIMIAYKWSKKSSFYGWKNPTSMPLLALNEEEEEEEEEEERGDNLDEQEVQVSSAKEADDEELNKLQERRNRQPKGFKSCFSLTDLYE
ncbi:unnamed protein product [Ilex paraguariensis]|uniref:Uncharacterized protein n=1 Tax=Ilex paraguariensis TaxID=185542 RepID=A0ABC8RY68_9AQUA